MAACTLGGALTVKVVNPHSNIKEAVSTSPSLNKYGCPKTFQRISIPSIRQERASYSSTFAFGNPWRKSTSVAIKCSSAQAESKPGDVSEEKSLNLANQLVPSSQVESLLTSICDTTSIAEFKLNLGGFHLYVKRDLGGNDLDYIASITPQVYTEAPSPLPDSNGSVNSTSLVLSKSESSAGGLQGFLNAAHDEGLVMVQSPKVGVFRRSRTIKGKRAPPSCKEKQEVKEGQVLCFIEQLGGEIPIESDVSGEVVKILREDGEPVGYGDALVAILPSFPGIKKLQLPA